MNKNSNAEEDVFYNGENVGDVPVFVELRTGEETAGKNVDEEVSG